MLRRTLLELEERHGQETSRQRGTEDGAAGRRRPGIRLERTVPVLRGRVPRRGPAAAASLRERSHLHQEERPARELRLNRIVVKGRRRPAFLPGRRSSTPTSLTVR
jgi:hypothetical protein